VGVLVDAGGTVGVALATTTGEGVSLGIDGGVEVGAVVAAGGMQAANRRSNIRRSERSFHRGFIIFSFVSSTKPFSA